MGVHVLHLVRRDARVFERALHGPHRAAPRGVVDHDPFAVHVHHQPGAAAAQLVEGQIVAGHAHPGPAQRYLVAAGRDRLLTRPVQDLGFKEDDRIITRQCGGEQSLGVIRCRGYDDDHARDVHEVRLGAIAVVLVGPDPGTVRCPNQNGHVGVAPRAEPYTPQVAGDLIEGRVDEPLELDLGNGATA